MSETRSGRAMDSLKELARRESPRKRPKVAFVLSGGGNLGAIQVGMLRALVERDVFPDIVLGCSVGAMNGAGFAHDPTIRGIDRLSELWISSAKGDVMPSSRIPNVVHLLRKSTSIYQNSSLRTAITDMLGDAATFDDLKIPFECNAVDVESSMTTWFSEGQLIEPLLASGALPAVFPPVEIDGRTYIDGGVIENVPIGRAVELGCRTIYVLHMGPHGRPDPELKRPLDVALLAYWVARNSQFAKDLAGLPPKVEAVLLPTGQRPELRHHDFSQTTALMERGYEQTIEFLDKREKDKREKDKRQKDDSSERRLSAEILAPIERLVISARSRRWRQRSLDAANASEGAILSADEDGDDDSEEHSTGHTTADRNGDANAPAVVSVDGFGHDSD